MFSLMMECQAQRIENQVFNLIMGFMRQLPGVGVNMPLKLNLQYHIVVLSLL
jgi:hypothetical protein